jgi:hypothetical protein
MSVFHGNWDEDPNAFLAAYLQFTAASGDSFKARHFINYLGAGSEADDWYDELPQDEKKDWATIEVAFRKRWLNEEVLSISKETVTIENEPQPEPITSHYTSLATAAAISEISPNIIVFFAPTPSVTSTDSP